MNLLIFSAAFLFITFPALGVENLETDFDIFSQQLGAAIPLDPELLFQKLVATNGTASQPSFEAVLVPYGRSPERRFTDLNFPRTLMAWSTGAVGKSLGSRRRVLIGYTPQLEQLQFMSLDPNTGQTRFQVLNQYRAERGSLKSMPLSLVRPADRQACLVCHQSGQAVYSLQNWSETATGAPFGEPNPLGEKLAVSEPFAEAVLKLPLIGIHTEASKSKQVVGGPDYQAQVTSYNTKHLALNQCTYGCGEDVSCRMQIISHAYLRATNGPMDRYFPIEKLAQLGKYFEQNSKLITLADGLIEDRPEVLLNGHEMEIHAGEDYDPIIPRRLRPFRTGPRELGVDSELCFAFEGNFQKTFMDALSSKSLEVLVNRIWPPLIREIEGAVSGSSFPARLKKIDLTESDAVTIYPADLPQNQAIVRRPPVQSEKALSGLFIKYCSSCHATGRSIGGILPLFDLAALKGFKGSAERTIYDLLKSRIMPPPMSAQPTRSELDALIGALKPVSQ